MQSHQRTEAVQPREGSKGSFGRAHYVRVKADLVQRDGDAAAQGYLV